MSFHRLKAWRPGRKHAFTQSRVLLQDEFHAGTSTHFLIKFLDSIQFKKGVDHMPAATPRLVTAKSSPIKGHHCWVTCLSVGLDAPLGSEYVVCLSKAQRIIPNEFDSGKFLRACARILREI